MKHIFSISTLVVLTSAFASSAPLTQRTTSGFQATAFWNIDNPQPAPILTPNGTLSPQISIQDGSNEVDSIVSFSIPDIGQTASSTCQFSIQNIPAPTGSGIVQLFTLGAPVSSPLTSVPYENQYMGQYAIDAQGNSTPLDVVNVPCVVGDMQFLIRPQNTDDSISWTQTATVGAFIEVTV